MLTRKIGKIFFSAISPAQLIATAMLGATLGFMPGIHQALGLVLSLILLILILNTHLTLLFLIGLLAKLVAWVSAPLVFQVGRFLLDGPSQDFFTGLINAPVFALFGFEYYSTTGGLPVGMILGLLIGLILVKIIVGFRNKMAAMESSSDAFNALQKKPLVRILVFCLSGGLPKEGFKSLLQEKSPFIRVWGVVLTVVLAGGIYAALLFVNGPVAASLLKGYLGQANGATVDIHSLNLRLEEGKINIQGLAMTDPNHLETDLFRAKEIHVDIHASDLLRKRVNLEKVMITAAAHGLTRKTPGKRIGPEPKPSSPSTGTSDQKPSDEKGLDGYLKNAKQWQQQLSQAKRWLDKMSGATSEKSEKSKTEESAVQPKEENLDAWLDQQIRSSGYTNVLASHLIQGSPLLQIEKLLANKVTTTKLDENLDIHGFNLSTHPHLAQGTPRITVKSSKQTLDLDLVMAGVRHSKDLNTLKLSLKGLNTDTIADQISGSQPPMLSGGTFDVDVKGTIENRGGAYINLPLNIILNNASLTIPNQGKVPVKRFVLPLTARGPLDNPRIIVDQKQLQKSLANAGKSVLTNRLKKELQEKGGKLLKEKGGKLLEKLGGGGGEGGFKLPF